MGRGFKGWRSNRKSGEVEEGDGGEIEREREEWRGVEGREGVGNRCKVSRDLMLRRLISYSTR